MVKQSKKLIKINKIEDKNSYLRELINFNEFFNDLSLKKNF